MKKTRRRKMRKTKRNAGRQGQAAQQCPPVLAGRTGQVEAPIRARLGAGRRPPVPEAPQRLYLTSRRLWRRVRVRHGGVVVPGTGAIQGAAVARALRPRASPEVVDLPGYKSLPRSVV